MKIAVTFRNAEGETWQKEYVEEKLSKLKKYIDGSVEAHIVLSIEKFRNVAEISLAADGLNINGREEAKDMRLAIDGVLDKIERQLKKRKEKSRGHKGGAAREEADAGAATLDEVEDTTAAGLMETRKMVLEPMSLDDAVMRLESARNPFIVYRDVLSEHVHIVFRRDDGRLVLIETNA